MRCSICGAKLKKAGDICTNCYKELQEEEELNKDVQEKLRLKRKYLIAYEFYRYVELILVCILSMAVCFASGGIGEGLAVLGIFVLVFAILLFLDKRIAVATKAIFYEKRAVYKFKLGPINTTKTIKYEDISDVRIFQTRRQKKYGFGDVCVYTKSVLPGTGFFGGFQIKNIENVQENFEKIGEIIGKPIQK